MDGGDVDAELLLGCVAAMVAVEVDLCEESQVPWNTVPSRNGGASRRNRSPTSGVASPGLVSPAAKRVCQDNRYQLLTPPDAEFVEDVGESVQLNFPPRVTRSSVRKQQARVDRLAEEMCNWDRVSEGVQNRREQSVCEECVVAETGRPVDRERRLRSRSEAGVEELLRLRERRMPLTARRLSRSELPRERLNRVQDQAANHWPKVFNSPMVASGDEEANVSVTDEQAFTDAVSDHGRWRSSGSSSGSPGSGSR